MSETRRRFSREFKLEAVRQVVDVGRPLAQVARELDISASVLRRWKQRFEEDPSEAFLGNGRMKAEDEELRRLRREVVRLRQDWGLNGAVIGTESHRLSKEFTHDAVRNAKRDRTIRTQIH